MFRLLTCVASLALFSSISLSSLSSSQLISSVSAEALDNGTPVTLTYNQPNSVGTFSLDSRNNNVQKQIPSTWQGPGNKIITTVQNQLVILTFDYSSGAALFTTQGFTPPQIQVKQTAKVFASFSLENVVDVFVGGSSGQKFDSSRIRLISDQIVVDLRGCIWTSVVARIVIRFECQGGGGGGGNTPTPTLTLPPPTPIPSSTGYGWTSEGSSSDCTDCWWRRSSTSSPRRDGTGGEVISPSSTGRGRVVGDPQFTGFMGQSYQVHGTSNTIYSIISSELFQFNALFTYLSSGRKRKGTEPFSHPGNYFGSVGLMIKSNTTSLKEGEDEKIIRIEVISGPVDKGMKVLIDDIPLLPSSEKTHLTIDGDDTNSLHFSSPFELLLTTRDYTIKLQNSDMFINQQVHINEPLRDEITQFHHLLTSKGKTAPAVVESIQHLPHGILGQTFRVEKYNNRWIYIEGDLMDYIVTEGLMSTSTKFNRFNVKDENEDEPTSAFVNSKKRH